MAEAITAQNACAHFFNSLDAEKAREQRAVVEAFIEWFGANRLMAELTADQVSEYSNKLVREAGEPLGDDPEEIPLVEPLRAFLAYSSRLAFTTQNLVPALHLPAGGGGARGGDGAVEELGGRAFYITIEGLQTLEAELAELKGRRPEIAEELRAAMADKDFRENAPLDAARDSQAHLEARIRTIEDQLRHAVIIDESAKGGRANVGSTVRVLNLSANREQVFHLVSPHEVDPGSGKISVESPVGSAVINHVPGDEVTVTAPGGTIRLRVIEVNG